MWTREGILAIRDLEAPIRSSPEFQQYCLADSDVQIPTSPRKAVAPTYTDIKCARHSFRSPLDLLYFSGFLPNDLETITQEELDGALHSAIQNPNTWENFKILFDAEVSAENLKVKYIRTQLIFAGPFQYDSGKLDDKGRRVYERFDDLSDRLDD